jgi:hypothetical protein
VGRWIGEGGRIYESGDEWECFGWNAQAPYLRSHQFPAVLQLPLRRTTLTEETQTTFVVVVHGAGIPTREFVNASRIADLIIAVNNDVE